jgi:hypothetical protein
MTRATCSVDGCGRPAVIRGRCRRCYVRWTRNERRCPPCSEPGCRRGAYARGLCVNAYMRWWREDRKMARAGDGDRPGQSLNATTKGTTKVAAQA